MYWLLFNIQFIYVCVYTTWRRIWAWENSSTRSAMEVKSLILVVTEKWGYTIFSVNRINKLIAVMERRCVLFEVRTGWINIIHMVFIFKQTNKQSNSRRTSQVDTTRNFHKTIPERCHYIIFLRLKLVAIETNLVWDFSLFWTTFPGVWFRLSFLVSPSNITHTKQR